MLSKQYKLNSDEHSLLAKKGKRIHHPLITLQYMKQGVSPTKCSVVVPKKIYKTAVSRNRIRRKIAHIIKEIYPQVLPHHCVAVVVKSSLENIDNLQIKEVLESLFTKMNS